MLQAMEKSCRYPFAESQELIKLIAAKEGCTPENVVLGVGSGEILDIVGFHFGLQKGEIITADPGYHPARARRRVSRAVKASRSRSPRNWSTISRRWPPRSTPRPR